MGKYSEAEPYWREALEGRRRILGDEDPQTLNSITGLGMLLWKMGRYSEAEPYWQEALDGRRRVMGDEHRTTLLSISNMGLLRRDQGRLFEAEELFAEALRRARGAHPGDSVIGVFLTRHAQTLVVMERFEQAEAELVEAQEIFATAQWPAHASSNIAITALAELYDAWHAAQPDQGYDARAGELRAKLPADLRAASLIKLGKRLLGYGRHAEAEAVLSECLQIRREILPEGHWLIFNTMSTLGESLAGQGVDPSLTAAARIEKLREAEALLLEGYEGMKDHPAALDVRKRAALERIIKLYEAWHAAEPGQGYDAKAAEWRAKLPTDSD
jgi:non-specific serine/threonine protein kinase/serine/threonine-protein kinase